MWPRYRENGSNDHLNMMYEAALRRGQHVHRNVNQDETCLGGDSECPIFAIQLEEAMEAWQ